MSRETFDRLWPVRVAIRELCVHSVAALCQTLRPMHSSQSMQLQLLLLQQASEVLRAAQVVTWLNARQRELEAHTQPEAVLRLLARVRAVHSWTLHRRSARPGQVAAALEAAPGAAFGDVSDSATIPNRSRPVHSGLATANECVGTDSAAAAAECSYMSFTTLCPDEMSLRSESLSTLAV